MRLTRLEIENFKGIGERQVIEIRPITLLYGSNSAGKTTILQAVEYLHQILQGNLLGISEKNASNAQQGWENFESLVHCHDLEKVMRIKATAKLNENFYDEYFPINLIGQEDPDPTPLKLSELLGDAKFAGLAINYTVGSERSSKVIDVAVAVAVEVAWQHAPDLLGGKISHPFLRSLEIDINNQRIMTISPSQPSVFRYSELAKVEVNFNHHLLRDLDSANEIDYKLIEETNVYNLQEKKKKWPIDRKEEVEPQNDSKLETSDRGSSKKDAIPIFFKEIREIVVGIDSNEVDKLLISRFDLASLNKFNFHDGLQFGNDGAVPVNINFPVEFVSSNSSIKSGRMVRLQAIFSEFISGSIQTIVGATGASFSSRISPSSVIGPLRPIPPRGKSGTLLDTADDLECINSVNCWLERLGLDYTIKRFKLKLKLEPEETMDRSIDEEKLFQAKEGDQVIVKLYDKRREIRLDFVDVGVGVSQLVPVVVAAVCEGKFGLVKIEQPELHVHPEVQVELGDLFIESAREQAAMERTFLIETHSEHLLLRLLRRIQEATDNELPPGTVGLKAEDLSVIHVESVRTRKRRKTRIMRLRVDQDGEFVDRWPNGFFEERRKELF